MIPVYSVEQIRVAESRAQAKLGEGVLMERAVRGIVKVCREVLEERRGKLYGSRVVILVGAGNNGADAMWAGAELAKRGVQVTAVATADNIDRVTAEKLVNAGGRILPATISDDDFATLVDPADIVLDGLLGIGGKGALREPAATWSDLILDTEAEIVAVDLPSGVDPDTGVVENYDKAIHADHTVCLGNLKAGLVVGAGISCAGTVTLHDIGLLEYFEKDARDNPLFELVDLEDASLNLGEPGREDNKYTRGVVGVVTGSESYPGAAVLSTGSALRGGVGMVRYAGGARAAVANHWPEVVLADEVDLDSKTNAWVVGSGGGTDQAAQNRLARALDAQVPVVIDADGLTLLAKSDELRARVRQRFEDGFVTVLTPHDGEFARLGYKANNNDFPARIDALKQAANELGAVVLLKGALTLVAAPGGRVYANNESSSALATAGSGDILAGLLGSMLANDQATEGRFRALLAEVNPDFELPGHDANQEAAEIAACAALIHGQAGIEAAKKSGSVVATDILEALPVVCKQLTEVDLFQDDEEVL